MIISRTPFRISFAGGATDLRSFYRHEPGQVISTSISRFLYVAVRRQLGLVESKYRLQYSRSEFSDTIEGISHPIVREALRLYGINFPVSIWTDAEIPAYSGLGSSSAFSVGLIHAIHALIGQHITKAELAKQAAYLEMDVLGRTVGKQDHYASAFGGLNVLTFDADESVTVEPVFCRSETREALQSHLMMLYTGIKRDTNDVLVAQEKAANTAQHMVLGRMKDQVGTLRAILSRGHNLHEFGVELDKAWQLKKKLTDCISNRAIDQWYADALKAGAIGGKLLGAGGGGFLLLFVEPQNQAVVEKALGLYRVPFGFDTWGSVITYYADNL